MSTELTIGTRIQRIVAMSEQYPSEFRPRDHRAIVELERFFIKGVSQVYLDGTADRLYDKAESFWMHEQAMLGEV